MLLHCCYTSAHEVLYRDWFLPSIPPGFTIYPHRLDAISGPGDFLSPEFLQCIRQKMQLILGSLQNFPHEPILWSDVDILFGAITPDSLRKLLADTGKSLLFQQERPGMPDVNTGFFLCSPGPDIREFFQKIERRLAAEPGENEQMAANALLAQEPHPEIGHLPASFYARTHGWPPPQNFSIYHANYTKGADSVGQKIRQFREVRFLEKYGLPARLWSCLRRIPGKFTRPTK
jgi:hypothetical protein